MAKWTRGGYDVFVILLTVGDGFKEDAARYYLSLAVTPEEYLHMGYERQRETRQALAEVGVPSSHIYFLGFPDGGLDALWLRYWEEVWTSPTTQKDRVPYLTAWRPDASYQGVELLRLLLALYHQIRPTRIVMPSAQDTHPDHWATNAFATLAWAEMARRHPDWRNVERWGYLVHWPAWPMPLAYRPKVPAEPPGGLAKLSQEPWHHEALEAWMVEAKRRALMAYESQVELIKPFMLAFCRATEAFSVESQWRPRHEGALRVVENPPQDWLTRSVRKTNPLVDMRMSRRSLRVRWLFRPPDDAKLEIALKPIDGSETSYHIDVGQHGGNSGVSVRADDRLWEVSWPEAWLSEKDAAMVGVQALVDGKSLGKIPFRVLRWEA